MKYQAKRIASLVSLLFLSLIGIAQNTSDTGYVIFNLEKKPNPNAGRHELTLFGCNTTLSTTDSTWYGKKNLKWGTDNQVLSNVPFGYSKDSSYYVSKYYMASPPVWHVKQAPHNGKDSLINIGLVIPDHFTFFGNKPAQIVHLNYNLLQPVYLNYASVDFNNCDTIKSNGDSTNFKCNTKKHPTCAQLGFDSLPLPINIQCDDFKWRKDSFPPVNNAQGASGIGVLTPEENHVFLPSYAVGKDYLNCNITLLDDIILNTEVFFVTKKGLTKTISLTDFYKEHAVKVSKEKTMVFKKIELFCKQRDEKDIPTGCLNNNHNELIINK